MHSVVVEVYSVLLHFPLFIKYVELGVELHEEPSVGKVIILLVLQNISLERLPWSVQLSVVAVFSVEKRRRDDQLSVWGLML